MELTKEIINALGRRQVLRNHTPVAANISMLYPWEIDLFSFAGEYTWEFEVKISRADFLRDKKKKKWAKQEYISKEKIPNYMSYVCPEGLIQAEEIPNFAGLYYYANGEISEVVAPKLRHNIKRDQAEIHMKCARVHSQREFLGCTLLTHLNAEIKQRNDERERVRKEQQERFMNILKNKRVAQSIV